MARLTGPQIESLWIREGGDPKYARLMSHIALRESSGNPYATHVNSNGTIDRGLFQVNSIWGGLSRRALGDPVAATRAAIHILKVQGPRAWSTFNPQTDHSLIGAPPSIHAPSGPSTMQMQTGGTGLASLLAEMQSQPVKPQGSLLQAPAYSSTRYMPQGPVAPQSVGPKPQAQGSLSDLLAAMDQGQSTQTVRSPVSPVAGDTPAAVKNVTRLFERAAAINAEHLPYKWGGGHGPTPAKPGVPLDCSGAVSRLLGIPPRVSGQFESFGQAGRGRHVTIYANGTHVLMEINGHFWGTSATNPGGGAGWIPRGAIGPGYLKGFVARHPPGM